MSEFKTIIVGDRQSLSDLTYQEYGCGEAIFYFLKDNPGKLVGLHDVAEPGTELLVRIPVPRLTDTNQAVAAEFARRKIKVVSGAAAQEHTHLLYVETGYVIDGYVV